VKAPPTHAVGTEVAEAEDASTVGYADEADILLGPVPKNIPDLPAPIDRDIHPPGLAEDVTEFETGLADRRVVDDRQEAGWIGHDGPVKQGFIVVEQVDQVDVALEVCVLMAELQHHSAQLQVLGLGHIGYQTHETQGLPFGLGEGGGFVQGRILKQL
jgi:hypothetical protein